MSWLYATSVTALFIQPLCFVFLIIPMAVAAWLRRWRPPIWPFVVYGLLGSASQIFGPPSPYQVMPDPPWVSREQAKLNLIPPYAYSDLSSWDGHVNRAVRSIRQSDGFFRAKRYDQNGLEFSEIVTFRSYKVLPNQPYTMSFYFRNDGKKPRFSINFITPRGFIALPATIVRVGDGLWRAYATVTTTTADTSIRGLNLINFEGDWTYLDIAYIQLESGDTPHAYRSDRQINDLTNRLLWWLGTLFLGYATLSASLWLLMQVNSEKLVVAINLGLFVQFIVALSQFLRTHERSTGLVGNANDLGHFIVVGVALAWLLGRGSRWVLLTLFLGLGLIWLSESRAALMGLALVSLAWLWDHRKYWVWILFGGLLMSLGIWTFAWESLGRFTTSGDLSYFTTQARLQIWDVAREAFINYPFTGIGLNRFNIYYLDNIPVNAIEASAAHPHNLYWQLLSEGGLLGGAAFLFLWGWIMYQLFKLEQWVIVGFIGFVTTLNVFDLTWYTAGVYSGLWLAVALGLKRGLAKFIYRGIAPR